VAAKYLRCRSITPRRYRFTVRFLEELLRGTWHKNRTTSPHDLDAYVQQQANITPHDSNETILRGEQDTGPVDIGTFQWDKIKKGESHCSARQHQLIFLIDSRLLGELAYTIYLFITRGETPLWCHEQEPLVEYGLARFKCVGDGGNPVKITIEEPLALTSTMHYLESNACTETPGLRLD